MPGKAPLRKHENSIDPTLFNERTPRLYSQHDYMKAAEDIHVPGKTGFLNQLHMSVWFASKSVAECWLAQKKCSYPLLRTHYQ